MSSLTKRTPSTGASERTVKAITICQPYAALICLPPTDLRFKRIENRTWETLYRGPLAIHAGKSKAWLKGDNYGFSESELPFGAVVAVAQLTQCLHISKIRSGELHGSLFSWVPNHVHTEGPFCWVLENVVPLAHPVACSGKQGLWVPDRITLEIIDEELMDQGAKRC